MFVYRIVKLKIRTNDLSGTGAYRTGGRWNTRGTYMLYTSENSSLAYLETLVYFDEASFPPRLFIMKIEIDNSVPIYTLKEKEYPAEWMQLELKENKLLGDSWMRENKFLGVKVRSAINQAEANYLLNPLYPKFHDLVRVVEVMEIKSDERLIS